MAKKTIAKKKTTVNKKSTDIGPPYHKIGRLNKTVADKIKVKAADIYITDNQIKHIQDVHRVELGQLGISAIDFVKIVVRSFNQVRKGSNNSLLLIIFNENYHKTAAVSLNFALKKEFWEVKTAQPRRTTEINKKVLLWKACPRLK